MFLNLFKRFLYKIDYKKVVVKFIYSELKLCQLKTPLLMQIMALEFSSMNVNCDSYN